MAKIVEYNVPYTLEVVEGTPTLKLDSINKKPITTPEPSLELDGTAVLRKATEISQFNERELTITKTILGSATTASGFVLQRYLEA